MNLKKQLFLVFVFVLFAGFFAACETHTHSYGDWTITEQPTETVAGKASRKCTEDDTKEEVSIPALSNTSVWTVTTTAATCSAEGKKVYTSIYGKVEVTLPKVDHSYGDWTLTVHPTKTTVGTATRTCSIDNNIETKTDVPVLTDTEVWTLKTTLATCTTEGKETYTSIYGTVEVTLPKLDHSYGAWTIVTEPTKTTVGKATRTCSVGDEKEEKELPILTDTTVWTVTTIAATCTTEGKETYTSIYGTVEVILPKLGHSYGDWVLTVNPTKTNVGTATRTCSVDGHVETKTDVPVLTDTTVWTLSEAIPATCVATGKEVYTSSYGTVEVEIPLTGHSYGDWTLTVDPTKTTVGTATRTCSVDGHVETKIDVPVLTDTTVWTLSETASADYNQKGFEKYTSIYGVVTLELAKLVAPYDGKTYSSYYNDGRLLNNIGEVRYGNRVVEFGGNWSNVSITFNEFGVGEGTAYPFTGRFVISMKNPETGEIEITQTSYKTLEDETRVLDESTTKRFTAYVDMNSGIIVMPAYGIFNYVHILSPFEVPVTSNSGKASSWDDSMAMEYTYDETTYRIFSYHERVYFGVTFVDQNGAPVNANECYNNQYVYVKDAQGEIIEGFVFNGEKLVVVDGLEGKYLDGEDELVLFGYGTLTYKGVSGTYTLAEDGSNYTLDIFINNKETYYEVTLNQETQTFVIEQIFIEIIYNTNGFEPIEELESPMQLNKNIKFVLPTLTHPEQTFKGWFYDADCTVAVGEDFIPTSALTLYAYWTPKSVVTLVGVLDGDPSVLHLGVGDVIGDKLPKYTINEAAWKVFRGWYLIIDGEEVDLPLEAIISEEDIEFTLYARWLDLLPYYGEYSGAEVYGKASTGSSKYTITIDENGNITGSKKGKVVDYDPITQKITWLEGTVTRYFWFDNENKIIAGIYNSAEIGNDLYILGYYQKDKNIAKNYALNVNKTPETTVVGYYARFINIMTSTGPKNIFIYNNYIYANIIIKNVSGDVLEIDQIDGSKTVVIIDAATNDVIMAVASKGTSFGANSSTTILDEYFGVYTNGDETLVLDGAGNVTYGTKTGVYTKSLSGSYGFDVELEGKTEYYRLTLDGSSFEIVKPMVEISFVVPAGQTAVMPQQYNITVKGILPYYDYILASPMGIENLLDGYVFNGWFKDPEFTQPVDKDTFKPYEAITLYGKFSVPAILSIKYNNDSGDKENVYSVNDIATIAIPEKAKHTFEGWFTNEACTEGYEWENGNPILADITIWAKWELAPNYSNQYLPVGSRLDGTKEAASGKLDDRPAAKVYIDPYGIGVVSAYPFNGGIRITDYDAVTGNLVFNIGTKQHRGKLHSSGILVVNEIEGLTADITSVWVLTPFDTAYIRANWASSYWNSGKSRAIQYTYDGTTYSIFIYNNEIHFDVTFKDMDGNDVASDDCYQSDTLYVRYAANDELIASFGFNGTTMVPLDGYEGTYTGEKGNLILNGVSTISINGVIGTYKKSTTGSSYTFDVYLDDNKEYYEVTINEGETTYTINQPMVDIIFSNDKGPVAPKNINKNIVVRLPELIHDDFVFRGWYTTATFETKVDFDYLPTSDITLYAKWDEKVILTVVYDNGLANDMITYGAGDTTNPIKPSFTNGKIFDGWFADEALTIPYTPGVIIGNTTIYCRWKEAHALYGNYSGANVYGSGASGGTNSGGSSKVDISINELGTVTNSSRHNGPITSYDLVTGNFIITNGSTNYFGNEDLENGVIAVSYASSLTTLGGDLYIYVAGLGNFVSSEGSHWLSGKARLTMLKYNDGTTDRYINVFIYNDKVYGNVTWESTDATMPTAKTAYQAGQLTVKDSKGNVIASFIKDGSALKLAS